ncbi:MAG TPA: ComEC/Rec2 family competence protein [Gaiellaceae bacterium]|nr:ComEC/Rec2 family competence protein [Gaiellaceae bacterium]
MSRLTILAVALAAGLGFSTAVRVPFAAAAAAAALVAVAQPRIALAAALAAAGWWWGSLRVHALERTMLAAEAGTAGHAVLHVAEPPRRGRFEIRVRADVRRWRGAPVHEPVQLELPASRAPPPQGATLAVLGTLRLPDGADRTRLRRRGVHVELRASSWRVLRLRGGLADRLHAWLARASTPGLAGERRAVLEGVVLGEDGGLSETLRQRFRASGLYHLLAVSGGNVVVVAGGAGALVLLAGLSRVAAELAALAAIAAYVLAVGPQPSVIRAGVAGALVSLAWLSGRERDRWHALALGAVALLAWNPWNVLDPGFQLSFAAVAAIFAFVPRVLRVLEGYPGPRLVRETVALSVVCGVVTAPISWFHFHAVPVLTVPANTAAALVAPPMLALALLAAVVPPAGPLLAQLAGWCAAYLAGCARFFGGLPGAQVRSSAAAAGLAAVVLLAAAYACRRGERVGAGLSPARKRPAEDRPRSAAPP